MFALRTDSFFSVDDYAILGYFKTHTTLQMIPDFLVNGDIYFFRRLVGFILFGSIYEVFGVNHLAFDLSMFVTNTANLVLLFLIVRKLSKNNLAAFFVSLIFNKNYLFYYSNLHEHILATFCLLCIYLFLKYPKKLYLSAGTLVLALFTKETASTTPLVLLAISFFRKLDRKKILVLLGISFLYGIYALYFFITEKVLIPNFSYSVSPTPKDVLTGILFFIDYKALILLLGLPLVTGKYKYLPLLFVAIVTLVPASLLVNRRELYYLYMPFSYLMIYLGMHLSKLKGWSVALWVLVLLVFGGRDILPKIAWRNFPNWQKVSMQNVLERVEEQMPREEIYIGDIHLERDARLMLESNTLDLFLNPQTSLGYEFSWDEESGVIKTQKKN